LSSYHVFGNRIPFHSKSSLTLGSSSARTKVS
jgi:hypothetical protein